ncbi:uncharacterized protein LOC129911132 [Episyrphus balteatus]|uniref:uncharacterized protein LOC129911132 n=1 Tax=Episyrphus balteatus TaxID=286459 RepID=UPI00248573B4|nr:uncharacterized protein LOC129911132 [Episyrphus balteatus]
MYQIPKFHPKKMAKRRRKLRSLIAQKAAECDEKTSSKIPIFIGCVLLIGLIVAVYLSNISTSMIWSDFLTTYRNQYNLIVHGEKDYCLPSIDREKLFSEIRKKVLNQETALSGIELQLRNDSKFVAIAVTGASGVGKSLFVQEFRSNYPWQENIQTESWSTYNIEDHKKQIETFTRHFSECGRNLIIIDNLEPKDVDFIQGYNRFLHENVLKQDSVSLAIVYVFNIVTYTDEQRANYTDNLQLLMQLENVRIIEFRKFNSNDVSECIRHEARHLNLTLDDGDFDEISKLIDANRSGCKNVYSKVLMYGKRRNL